MPPARDPRAPAFPGTPGWGLANVPPPAAPTGLVARRVSESRADLAWDPLPANATRYEVWRTAADHDNMEWWGPAATDPYTLVHAGARGDTSWSDTDLDPSQPYTYKVRAFRPYRYSAWSGPATPLLPPAVLAGRTEEGLVEAWWRGGPDGTTYDVQHLADAAGEWQDLVPEERATSVTVAAMPGESHWFQARSRLGGEVSNWSRVAQVTTEVAESTADLPGGVTAGRAVAVNPATGLGYAAATHATYGLSVVEFDYRTMRVTRTFSLDCPLTRLDVLWCYPGAGGWLYGFAADERYLVQVSLTTREVTDTLDLLAAAGVSKLSGGFDADWSRGKLYLSANGDGEPDVIEVTFTPPGGLPTMAVSRVLTLSGVGGTRAGAIALDPTSRRLYVATMSTVPTGHVAGVNVDSFLQEAQASFAVAEAGQANYRMGGALMGDYLYLAPDHETAPLVRVRGSDLSHQGVLNLAGFGWARDARAVAGWDNSGTPTEVSLHVAGQDTETGKPAVQKVDLTTFLPVARVQIDDEYEPVLTATAVGPHEIDLAWIPPVGWPGGLSYTVLRTAGGGGSVFEVLAATEPGVVTYVDTNVSPGTTYSYKVRAYKEGDGREFLDPFLNVANSVAALAGSLYGFLAGVGQVHKLPVAAATYPPSPYPDPPSAQWNNDRGDFAEPRDQSAATGEGTRHGERRLGEFWEAAEAGVDRFFKKIELGNAAVTAQLQDVRDKLNRGDREGAALSVHAFAAPYLDKLKNLPTTIPVLDAMMGLGVKTLQAFTVPQAQAADPAAAARGSTAGEGHVNAAEAGAIIGSVIGPISVPEGAAEGVAVGVSRAVAQRPKFFLSPRSVLPDLSGGPVDAIVAGFVDGETGEVLLFSGATGGGHDRSIAQFGLNKDRVNGFGIILEKTKDGLQAGGIFNGSGATNTQVHPEHWDEVVTLVRQSLGGLPESVPVMKGSKQWSVAPSEFGQLVPQWNGVGTKPLVAFHGASDLGSATSGGQIYRWGVFNEATGEFRMGAPGGLATSTAQMAGEMGLSGRPLSGVPGVTFTQQEGTNVVNMLNFSAETGGGIPEDKLPAVFKFLNFWFGNRGMRLVLVKP